MDIRVLKYFLQVAKEMNFTRAAEKLYISQPALSKMIKKLETELGIPLFDVRSTGVFLTDYGQALYQRALPLVQEFDSLTTFVDEMQGKPEGKLRVGVTPMVGSLYVVDIITAFNDRWPNVELSLIEEGSIALRQRLLNGELNLVLCISGDALPGLKDTILLEEEMVAVVSSQNPLARYKSLDFSQLRDQPLNMYSRYASLRRQIEERCLSAGFVPKVNITTTQINILLQMTSHNRGISILPRPHVIRNLQDDLIVLPFTERFPWQVCLVENENIYKNHLHKLFEDFIFQRFEEYKAAIADSNVKIAVGDAY